ASKQAAEEKIAELELQVKESLETFGNSYEKLQDFDRIKLEFKELESRLQETEYAKQTAEEKITTLEIQVKESLESFENSEKKLQDLERIQLEYQELETRLNETETAKQTLELQLRESLANAEQKLASLAGSEEKLNDLQREKQEDDAAAQISRQEIEMLQQKIEILQQQNSELNSHNKEKTEVAEDLQREMLLLQDKFTTLETAWQEQEQSIAKIQSDY
ncbi:hypothetical protein PSTG_18584, partial [Puccinia striiformis f. sp. tritici PST-78]